MVRFYRSPVLWLQQKLCRNVVAGTPWHVKAWPVVAGPSNREFSMGEGMQFGGKSEDVHFFSNRESHIFPSKTRISKIQSPFYWGIFTKMVILTSEGRDYLKK